MSKKVVLGFSGGLDTTYCVKYLTEEKGYEVHSVIVNTGGFTEEELKKIEAHAYALGVKSHSAVNAVKTYYDKNSCKEAITPYMVDIKTQLAELLFKTQIVVARKKERSKLQILNHAQLGCCDFGFV